MILHSIMNISCKFLLNNLFNRFHATRNVSNSAFAKVFQNGHLHTNRKNCPLKSFAIYGTSMTLLSGGTDALVFLCTVPLYSELERLWSSRALQSRNEKNDLTTP